MTEEPIYQYVKGQGWVIAPPLFCDFPVDILDLRNDKTQPGVWAYQIWLVGIRDYEYQNWVDNYANYRWGTLDDAKNWIESRQSQFNNELLKEGMRQRFVNLDARVRDYYPR